MPRIDRRIGDALSKVRRAAEDVSRKAGDVVGDVKNKLETVQDFFQHPPMDAATKKQLLQLARSVKASRPFDAQAPWSEIRNAHSTNTPAEMTAALTFGYDWLEGDIMLEGGARNVPGWSGRDPIMAHGTRETLQGMTLDEWLQIGKASGRGLKLDVKQAAAFPAVIAAVKRARVPQERLIFNADVVGWPKGMEGVKYRAAELAQDRFANVNDLVKVRKEFPDAMINIGALSARKLSDNPKHYTREQVGELIAAAKKIGGPVMFPLRAELLTEEIVKELSQYGHVAVWNWPIDTKLQSDADVARERKKFLSWGATGTIDLRPADAAH